MARGQKNNGDFNRYLTMGAGFAAGAAIVSVVITGITIAANEAYKAFSGKVTAPPAVTNGSTAQGEFPDY